MPGIQSLQKRMPYAGSVLCIWACWLVLHRYHGFYQDTYIYAFLAIFHQDPVTFQNDLFVKFGSQSGFSIFPAVYSAFIRWLGIGHATLWLMIVGQGAWLGAITLLIRRICPGWTGLLCLAAVLLVSPYYDPFLGFSYGEPFPTSRIFAETFCMLGINMLWGRRYVLTAILLLLGAILHPLISVLPCALAGVIFLTDRQLDLRLRGLCAGAVAILGTVVGISLVGPGNLDTRIDMAWFHVIERYNLYLFPQAWTPGALCKFAYFVLIFGLAGWLRLVAPRRMLPVLVGCMAALFTVWLIGTGRYSNAFITQLQLWRGLWLFQIIGLIINVMVLARLWQGSVAQRWCAACMTLGLLTLGFLGRAPGTAPAFMMTIIGCAAGALLSQIPARYLNHRLWRLMPLVLVVPQLFGLLTGNENIRLGLSLLLACGLIFCRWPNLELAIFCTLCALGLKSYVDDSLLPAVSLGAFLVWLVLSEKPLPVLGKTWCRGLMLTVVVVLFACLPEAVWQVAHAAFLEQVVPHLGSHFLLWEAGAVCVAALLHLFLQQRMALRPGRTFLPALAGLCSLTAAVCFWLPDTKQADAFPAEAWTRQLQAKIPRQAVVLSDRGVAWSWFVLHRSFYASHIQMFGNVFSRENAIEGYRRRQFLCAVDADFCSTPFSSIRMPEIKRKKITQQDIASLCSDPALDFILLHGRYAGAEVFADAAGLPNSLLTCARIRDPALQATIGTFAKVSLL